MPFAKSAFENRAHDRIYLAIGANQPYRGRQPLENLNRALFRLKNAEIAVRACSRPWRTPAWPNPDDPPFVNGAVEIASALPPAALMERLHALEAAFGRDRRKRNAPRPLDLDLIDWRGVTASDPAGPILPHPRAHARAFVLLPLREIAPRWRHPKTGTRIEQLIAALPAAERAAARPAGGVLCAATDDLKR